MLSLKELEKSILIAKDRAQVYMLLEKNGIEVTTTKSLNKWISNSLRDNDYLLNRVLRAAKKRLEEIEFIS